MDLADLLSSTVKERNLQKMTNKVSIIDNKYNPNAHQLSIKGLALPQTRGSSPYSMSMIFSKVTSSDSPTPKHTVPYSKDGVTLDRYLEPLSVGNPVRVHCSCPNFRFQWSYYDKQNKALIGNVKAYTRKTSTRPPANTTKNPGMCKHLLTLTKNLSDQGYVKKDGKVTVLLKRILNRRA